MTYWWFFIMNLFIEDHLERYDCFRVDIVKDSDYMYNFYFNLCWWNSGIWAGFCLGNILKLYSKCSIISLLEATRGPCFYWPEFRGNRRKLWRLQNYPYFWISSTVQVENNIRRKEIERSRPKECRRNLEPKMRPTKVWLSWVNFCFYSFMSSFDQWNETVP